MPPSVQARAREALDRLDGKRPEIADARVATATVVCMADVKPERVTWLWRRRIPRGKLSIVEGAPGIGKSHLLLELTACTSTGRAMPDGDVPGASEVVMLMTAEDGLGDTIQPRLVAAGADLRRVFVATAVAFNGGEPRPWILPQDIAALREEIARVGAAVLIIDPISAFLGDDTKSHNEHSMRRALTPLAALAEELGIAIIVVRHLVKNPTGDAISAGGGSIATIAVARACLVAARDPEHAEQVILASVKNNLSRKPGSLKYRLVEGADERSHVEWLGSSSLSADQLIASGRDQDERGALVEAMEWLHGELTTSPKPKKTLVDAAHQNGIAVRTLERAAEKLGVERRRSGFGGPVMWMFPNTPPTGEYDGKSPPNPLRVNTSESVPYSPGAVASTVRTPPGEIVPHADEAAEFHVYAIREAARKVAADEAVS